MENLKNEIYYLRRILNLRSLNLERFFIYKYLLKTNEAKIYTEFLMRILKWCLRERPTD